MAGCPKQVFPGVSEARFTCLITKAQASGIAITGNAGQASQNGITIAWDFDAGSQVLTLECLSAPFFAPCAVINAKLQELVNSCP